MQKVLVTIPIVLHNSGATPVVIENMSLEIADINTEPLRYTALHKLLYDPNAVREYATPFAVEGRSAVERVFEFQRDAPPVDLPDRTAQRFIIWVKAVGERRLGAVWPISWLPNWGQATWRPILTFELREPIWSGGAIPRDNKSADGPRRLER